MQLNTAKRNYFFIPTFYHRLIKHRVKIPVYQIETGRIRIQDLRLIL